MAKVKALLAEDDDSSRDMLGMRLEMLGVEVVMASNGTEAMQVIEGEAPPRLLLLDIMMPGVSGVQICQAVRKREPERRTYIIFLTALNRRDYLERAMEAGADEFISKPLCFPEFDTRVRSACRLLTLEDELARLKSELAGRS